MQHNRNQPHVSLSSAPPIPASANKKQRGSYNCGRCGLPKKGHVCQLLPIQPPPPSTPSAADSCATIVPTPSAQSIVASSASRPVNATSFSSKHLSHLRRALSFDDMTDFRCHSPVTEMEETEDHEKLDLFCSGYGRMPAHCMWEVFRRLPPTSLLKAARVCKGWRETTRKVWRAAEELRLTVANRTQYGFVGSVIQKCPSLVRLFLRMESDLDATILACVAFSCPNLESLDISTSSDVVNRITGDELGRFVADKRCLTSLKLEGCVNLGGFVLNSSSLSILWLTQLSSLSKMVFNCPSLKEVSLNFSNQDNGTTDLCVALDGLGRLCPRLQTIHIASQSLTHDSVLALTSGNLRWLRTLSLVLGSDITDASVASIVSSFPKLELLDLSGSSISDSGIGMICNQLPGSLSKLLLALCPNITSSGIQFAAAQLPLLELLDCGMTICDHSSHHGIPHDNAYAETLCNYKTEQHVVYQKLIIKHLRLKKLSLWGCSGLDALCLDCPLLDDLNLNQCSNLLPERLSLQCPKLQSLYASGCQDLLIGSIHSQVSYNPEAMANSVRSKRLPDGSKRIRLLPANQLDFNEGRRINYCSVIIA